MTELVERGWTVLPGLIEPAFLDALRSRIDRLFEEEGEQAGSEFKLEPGAQRLANLGDKGPVFIQVILEPRVLACIREVLGPRFKLSSLNARTAEPYNGVTQPLHADAGAVADEQGDWVANAVWLLDDFTAENGTLRAVPGSHRWRRLPEGPDPNEQLITGQAGDVIVMNAHVWHGGMANATSRPRRALHAFYTRRDMPQQQYQKRLLRAETIAGLPAEAREMLALDDPLNDELCSRQTGMSGFLR